MLALIVTAMELARFYAAALVGHYLGAVRLTLKSTTGISLDGFEENDENIRANTVLLVIHKERKLKSRKLPLVAK